MNKIVHIDANKKIYLFPDISYTTVYIKAGAAAMNVELIKADQFLYNLLPICIHFSTTYFYLNQIRLIIIRQVNFVMYVCT